MNLLFCFVLLCLVLLASSLSTCPCSKNIQKKTTLPLLHHDGRPVTCPGGFAVLLIENSNLSRHPPVTLPLSPVYSVSLQGEVALRSIKSPGILLLFAEMEKKKIINQEVLTKRKISFLYIRNKAIYSSRTAFSAHAILSKFLVFFC